ncbi:hypothetical protein BEE12_16190 [Pantoea agglomerans]|uniref:hypothetical protein n=1 Tax=Enterobacter agglomerans TaxID=549 RepID=UPI00083DB5B4|nr:hypothetical protein [Pantoea agglomerans]AOE41256.1 hypothetical protein BEE12_16190 [Pantoea agglomerans]
MKLIIIAAMASVLFVAPSMAKSHHHQRKHVCPTPTTENSGLVGEDSNGDGYIDHVWRIYTTGDCVLETVKNG